MMSLSDNKQADIIGAFNTTYRYLDDISNINIIFFTIYQVKYNLKSFHLINLISLIPMPRFSICIWMFLMILFPTKNTINVTILILKLSISLD